MNYPPRVVAPGPLRKLLEGRIVRLTTDHDYSSHNTMTQSQVQHRAFSDLESLLAAVTEGLQDSIEGTNGAMGQTVTLTITLVEHCGRCGAVLSPDDIGFCDPCRPLLEGGA